MTQALTGNNTWHPASNASGNTTDQSHPGICHPRGSGTNASTAIAANIKNEITNESQKRFAILGISSQKFERSTSFFVAPQLML